MNKKSNKTVEKCNLSEKPVIEDLNEQNSVKKYSYFKNET